MDVNRIVKNYLPNYSIKSVEPDAHSFLSAEKMEKMLTEYEHPITKEVGEKAREVGEYGGMVLNH